MKKALIVVNLAGFLNFLWNDIEVLQKMGYQVDVAMNGRMADGKEAIENLILKKKNIKYYQVDFNTKQPINSENWKAYKQLREVLKQKYDIIHCHTPIVGMIVRTAAKKYIRKGTKVIYTTHGFTFTDRSTKKEWFVYHSVENVMSKLSDVIITINHEDYNNAKKMHCKNVFLIPGVGLKTERFEKIKIDRDEYRKKLGVSQKDKLVLAVGELSERKNQKIIIKALSMLPDKNKYVFFICGRAVVDSTLDKQLEKLAERLNVRVKLLGHRSDIPQINACADIAVLPSLREGLGMAGLEALASGVPVVGADVQGIREYVVNGETGYLCNPTKEKEFANAIDRIANMQEDEYKEMSKKCKKMAKKFDELKSKEAMKEIYTNLIKRK